MQNTENKYDFNNPKLKTISRNLRKAMTPQERRLWYACLKALPWTIRRQYVISEYVVDFYCAEKRIAIEIDGSEHYEPSAEEKDRIRTQKLNSLGVTVIRYDNHDVNKHFKDVCNDIYDRLAAAPSVRIPQYKTKF